MDTTVKKYKYESLFLILPALYLVDLFLGFNVHLITIPGLPGANILLAFLSLAAYLVFALVTHPKKLNIKGFFKEYVTVLDILIFVFLAFNMIWVLVAILNGGNVSLAIDEVIPFAALLLYYPTIYLVRMGRMDWRKYLKFIFVLAILLSVLHLVIYFGEKIVVANPSDGVFANGFSKAFFKAMNKIRIGDKGIPAIIKGVGYSRAIFPTSILLMLGIFVIAKWLPKLKIRHYAYFALILTALLATITKSIWFGAAAGIFIYLVCVFAFIKDKQIRKRLWIFFITAALTVGITNFIFFDNLVFIRVYHAFETSESSEEEHTTESSKSETSGISESSQTSVNSKDSDTSGSSAESGSPKKSGSSKSTYSSTGDTAKDELFGTKRANDKRVKQMDALFDEWKQNPVFGHGYGHYVKDHIRSKKLPYSYEMFLPALVMKIGIVGLLGWAAFGLYILVILLKRVKKHPIWVGAILLLWASLLIAGQNNPIILNFSGMTIIVTALVETSIAYNSKGSFKEIKEKAGDDDTGCIALHS